MLSYVLQSSKAKLVVFALQVVFSLSILGQAHAKVDADVLLENGLIVDGTGSDGKRGDVAIAGDRIVAVGQFERGDIDRTIDCQGLVVAPGFIDLHNHSDAMIGDDSQGSKGADKKSRRIVADGLREAACYLTQGCTTIVTGNCGGGAVDVEEYYQAIQQKPAGVNVAHLIPQASLRHKVIGQSRRAPTDKELAKMQELARQGMQAGAWGMSTGLQYVPGSFATTDELIAIAKAVGEEGGIYASHMRNEGDQLLEAIQEALDIGRGADLPVHISHLKASQKRNWGKLRAAAALINEARDEGLRVTADQYPYNASSTSISAMLLPDKEREGGNAAIRKKLDDPAENQRLRQLISDALEGRGPIMVASCPEHPEWVGKLISEIAKEEKREPVEVAIDILRSSDQQGVSFSMDDRDLYYAMTLPWVATASDGSVKIADGTNPHPRSFGTFPRKIGRFAL
ncbi:MAG: amidohydrolase family protein, partial [Lacipirellulaceae bacterium]